jgi:hypothetical protein
MATRKVPAKRRPAVNRLAQMLGAKSTEDENITIPPSKDEVSRVMAALGRKGGKVGGAARANALTKERRSEIAKTAAKKRWGAKRMDPKDPDYKKRVAALVATKII